MAYKDPARELGTVKSISPAADRRRQQRERANEISERAKHLLENDPDINTWQEARRAAREQLQAEEEYEAGLRKGTVNPRTGNPKRRRRPARASAAARPGGASSRQHRSSRPSRRATRFARETGRAVVAPYGSVGAAGWTLLTGAASIVLFGMLLKNAGTVDAFTNAVAGGMRRVADPFTPLLPDRVEAAPPPATQRTVTSAGNKQRPRRPQNQGRARPR